MKVFVNDTGIDLFEGATVRDALNKYFSAVLKRGIKTREPHADIPVYDKHGNMVMPDGSLSADDRVYVDAGKY
ncbi:MAG: hypothetical protein EA408_00750 [Marinilabiliales bacterium]|nr:MAG: hypothetical protein EA408_00750 [Marinilabiliales bacterium]